jgi:hypothetical protein
LHERKEFTGEINAKEMDKINETRKRLSIQADNISSEKGEGNFRRGYLSTNIGEKRIL